MILLGKPFHRIWCPFGRTCGFDAERGSEPESRVNHYGQLSTHACSRAAKEGSICTGF